MSAHQLPPNPSLQNLRKQAKTLRGQVRRGEPAALATVNRNLAGVGSGRISLAVAQLIVARQYGFASWRQLRTYLDVVARYTRSPHRTAYGSDFVIPTAHSFLRLACLTYGVTDGQDDTRRPAQAQRLLAQDPTLARVSIAAAAAAGDADAVRDLLRDDPTLADRDGGPYQWPPLLYLAYSRVDSAQPEGALRAARLLLDHGADPNAGFLSDGEPPALTALAGVLGGGRDPANQPRHRDGLRLARLLLAAGADANDARVLTNVGGNTTDDEHLVLLIEFGLGRGTGGPWKTRLGPAQPSPVRLVQDQLLIAADLGLMSRIALLLRHCAALGIDIDAIGVGPGRGHQRGRTARELAVLGGHTEAERLLVAAGAGPVRLDAIDLFAAACLRADRDTALRLVAEDPTLIQQCEHRYLPWRAAIMNRPGAIELIASLGFDVNANNHGTPLHVAAHAGNLAAVKALVAAGADPTAAAGNWSKPGDPTASIEDPTPIGFARHRNHRDVVDFLASLD